jgi:hypothetical protein
VELLKAVQKSIDPSAENAAQGDTDSELEDIQTRIATLAYYKAEARGYEPGHELQDWLEAEAEVLKK